MTSSDLDTLGRFGEFILEPLNTTREIGMVDRWDDEWPVKGAGPSKGNVSRRGQIHAGGWEWRESGDARNGDSATLPRDSHEQLP
jgi:hypothetical protein